MVDALQVNLGPLRLANPVLVAAGTFGYGVEFLGKVRVEALGGLITKTLTLAPRQGHPAPRLVETPAGLLNSVGLQNVGLEQFLLDKLPKLETLRIPIIVSVLAETLGEAQELCGRLDKATAVSAIELNLSCPNLPDRHDPKNRFEIIAQDPEATADLIRTARAATRKPLIAKLSPDVTDITVIARAAEQAGADAVSVGNTFTGMSIDVSTRRSRLGSMTGGLSGPAIRPLAVYRVWRVRQAVRCPIIGVGGIVHAQDALEFLIAGATAVAVGTATFSDPTAAIRVIKGLRDHVATRGLHSISDVIGTLQGAPA